MYEVLLKKIIAFLLGLIIILLVLEIALHLIGFTYESYSPIENLSVDNRQCDFTILSIGDSFTRGMGAPAGKDFSTRLEQMLNSKIGKSFKVVNGGLSGANSSQILRKLKSMIHSVKPDLLIVMPGGANIWNLWGMEAATGGGGISSAINDLLYRIHVFKLVKLLY